MKREDLKKIEGLSDEAIDKIMALSGQDTEAHKKALATLETERDQVKAQVEGLNAQLTEAGKQIEGFKGMDIDGIKKAADDWKAQAEKAQADAKAQVEAIRFEHALQAALATFNVHDPADVIPHLKRDALKLGDDGKTFIGLKEQIEPLQTSKAYLFRAAETDPKIVDKTQPTNTQPTNPFIAAVYKGAGIERKS